MIAKFIDIDWNQDLPIFSSANYLGTISEEFGWIGGFENEQLLFILPFVIYHKLIFGYAQFQSGVIALHGKSDQAQEALFLEKVMALLQSKVDFIIQPPTHALFHSAPEGAKQIEYGTYWIDLQKSEEEIWAGMNSKHRNKIKKAENQNITVKSGMEWMDLAHGLLVATMQRSQMSFMGKADFDKLLMSLGSSIEIYVAFLGEEPQGCLVVFYSNQGAYVEYAGSIEKPVIGSMNYLHWYAMKELKGRGARMYDFVGARLNPQPGSKLAGIQQFKRQFGCELEKGYLWKYVFSQWKYKLYTKLLKLKHHGGNIDIIDEEFDEQQRRVVPLLQG